MPLLSGLTVQFHLSWLRLKNQQIDHNRGGFVLKITRSFAFISVYLTRCQIDRFWQRKFTPLMSNFEGCFPRRKEQPWQETWGLCSSLAQHLALLEVYVTQLSHLDLCQNWGKDRHGKNFLQGGWRRWENVIALMWGLKPRGHKRLATRTLTLQTTRRDANISKQ